MEHLTRQADLIPKKALLTPVTIIGAGAVGGWVTLSLAKMGMTNITVFDFDKVSIENMNSQFYRFSDIGKHKVAALYDLVKDFTLTEIVGVCDQYTRGKFQGIVISAVDSMSVRARIWSEHEGNLGTDKLIDPRMGAEHAKLYVMDPCSNKDIQSYKKTLYSDSEAVEEACTAKATIYTANLLAGMVCKGVKDVITGNKYARVTEYNIAANAINIWTKE